MSFNLFIDSMLNNEHSNNTVDIPVQINNDETRQINESISSPEQYRRDEQRQTIIPVFQSNSLIHNNHNEEEG